MSETQVNLNEVKPIEGGPSVDLWKFDKKTAKIETAEVMQVPSKYTSLIEGTEQHHLQWVLKVQSVVLETVGEGEEQVKFRASELFNLVQDKVGKLEGFPTGESSNLMKFLKDLKINEPEKLKDLQKVTDAITGKDVLIKSYDKEIENNNKRTYLKFRY